MIRKPVKNIRYTRIYGTLIGIFLFTIFSIGLIYFMERYSFANH